MSALIVSDNGISALVDILIDTLTTDFNMDYKAPIGKQRLFDLLHWENQLSLFERYGHRPEPVTALYIPAGDLPTDCERHNLSLHDILRELQHYDYQACDHKAYRQSFASAMITESIQRLIDRGADGELSVINWGVSHDPQKTHDRLQPVETKPYVCPDALQNTGSQSDRVFIATLIRHRLTAECVSGVVKPKTLKGETTITVTLTDQSPGTRESIRQFSKQFEQDCYSGFGLDSGDLQSKKTIYSRERWPEVRRIDVVAQYSDSIRQRAWTIVKETRDHYSETPDNLEEAQEYYRGRGRGLLGTLLREIDSTLSDQRFWETLEQSGDKR